MKREQMIQWLKTNGFDFISRDVATKGDTLRIMVKPRTVSVRHRHETTNLWYSADGARLAHVKEQDGDIVTTGKINQRTLIYGVKE